MSPCFIIDQFLPKKHKELHHSGLKRTEDNKKWAKHSSKINMKHIDLPESVMIFNSVLVKFKLMKLKNAIQKAKSRFKLTYFKLIEPLMITIVHY